MENVKEINFQSSYRFLDTLLEECNKYVDLSKEERASKKEEISAQVIDMFTIKPLDQQLILEEAKGKKLIVTIENHSIYGGLGSAVAEVMAESNIGVPLKRIGVDEKFGQVGTAEYLQEAFGLTADQMKETIKACL